MRKIYVQVPMIVVSAIITMLSLCALGDTYRRMCPQCGKTWWTDSPLDNFCGQCRRSAKEIDHKFDNGTSATSTSDIYWQGRRNMQKARLDRNRKFHQQMGNMLDQHFARNLESLKMQADEIARTQGADVARAFLQQKFEEDRRQNEAILRIPKWNVGTYQLREQMTQGMFNQWFRSGRPDELQKLKAELSSPMGDYHAQFNPHKYQMMCQRYRELTGQGFSEYGGGQTTMPQSRNIVSPMSQNGMPMMAEQAGSIDPSQMAMLQQAFGEFMRQYGQWNANAQGTEAIRQDVVQWHDRVMAKFKQMLAEDGKYRQETSEKMKKLAKRLGMSRCQELWANINDLTELCVSQVLIFREGFEFVFDAKINGAVDSCRQKGVDVVTGFADAMDLDRDGIISENEFVSVSLAFCNHASEAGYDYKKPLAVLQMPILMDEKERSAFEYQTMKKLHKGKNKTITKQYLSEYIRVLLTALDMFSPPDHP